MNRLALLALSLAPLAACGAPTEAPADEGSAGQTEREYVAPVVLNIGIDQLHVARFELDLRANIARFTEPAATLPLDRVVVFGQGPDETPEHLDDVVSRCYERLGYDVTGGTQFIVGQGEDLLTSLTASGAECAECGAVVICGGSCPALGPGEVPRGDPSSYDTDPSDGIDSGTDSGSGDGESGGSGSSGNEGDRSGGDSGSGADSGGNGGSHGGVGQPGGGGGGWD